MIFNATFNNISVKSWWSVLLVEETGVPAKKTHQPTASHFYKKTSLVVTAGFQTVRKKFEDTKGSNQKPLMDG